MSNVLCFTVPAPSPYPTVNTMWATRARSGKKTAEYHELFDAVFEAATAEIGRAGWNCAEYLVDVTIALYHRTGTFPDNGNIGKVEEDALTAAGIWVDDKLADPVRRLREYDPSQESSSVTIILRRRFVPYVPETSVVVAKVRKNRAKAARDRAAGVAQPAAIAASAPVGKYIEVNGKPQPYDETMAEIREKYLGGGGKGKGKRR
jgi:Holliday junction resolvase RusA-like endonuclease